MMSALTKQAATPQQWPRRKPPPLLPRASRRLLTAECRRDISIHHHLLLDAIAKGQGDAGALRHLAQAVLTWRLVAERMASGRAGMQQQVELVERLLLRCRAAEASGFEEDDYRIAREGVMLMDRLAGEVDEATWAWAADFSEHEIERQWSRTGAP